MRMASVAAASGSTTTGTKTMIAELMRGASFKETKTIESTKNMKNTKNIITNITMRTDYGGANSLTCLRRAYLSC